MRFRDAPDSDGHTDGRHVPDGPQVADVRADIRGVDQQRRGPRHHDPDTRAPVDQHAALPEGRHDRHFDDRIEPFPAKGLQEPHPENRPDTRTYNARLWFYYDECGCVCV